MVTDSQFFNSNYAKKNYPSVKLHSPEFSFGHRSSIMSFLNTKKMKLMLPGNFNLTIGMILDLKYPKRGNLREGDELDSSFSGRSMIIAVRQIIRPTQHDTVLEVASDSDIDSD